MPDPISLADRRLESSDDNTKTNPHELLHYAARDLDSRPVVRAIVLAEVENPDGTTTLVRYRAGVTRYQEQAILHLASYMHLQQWLD